MTLTDGTFQPDSEEVILDAMLADAEKYWDEDVGDESLVAMRRFYRPIAERLAEAQEDIGLVLEATQIDNATGEALDLLCSLIGVSREKGAAASGFVEFSRNTPAEAVYTAPAGTRVQTRGSDPARFETIEPATIRLIDQFNSNELIDYGGDGASFSVQSNTVLDKTASLRADAVDGAEVFKQGISLDAGSKFQFFHQLDAGAVSVTKFARDGSLNAYEIVLDEPNDSATLNVVVDGNRTQLAEVVGAGLPAATRLTVNVDWNRDGNIEIGISTDSQEITSLSATDDTLQSGQVSFESGNATGNKYWDFITMTAVDVAVEAIDVGPSYNTGPGTVRVFESAPSGMEVVDNYTEISGGSLEETDEELRNRTKEELSKGSRASKSALYGSVSAVKDTKSVFVNGVTEAEAGTKGFEIIVQGGDKKPIAETIFKTMAAGDTSHGGVNGNKVTADVEMINGQTYSVDFSRPDEQKIYVEADLSVVDTFPGVDAVEDSVVEYIGGTFNTGNDTGGLGAGEDVVYERVKYNIIDVEGVYDVENLVVGIGSGPTETNNIAIANSQVATSDGRDSSLSFTTTTL